MTKEKEMIEEFLGRAEDGNGYGDPQARQNDDRRLQALLTRELTSSISEIKSEIRASSADSSRMAVKMNRLTFFLVVVGVINIFILALQLRKP